MNLNLLKQLPKSFKFRVLAFLLLVFVLVRIGIEVVDVDESNRVYLDQLVLQLGAVLKYADLFGDPL